MLVVRAIHTNDLDALLDLAGQVGIGMTTLKPDRAMLAQRIELACASFAEQIPPAQRDYLFVMEDVQNASLAGVCAIRAGVGLDEPFYNYRIGTLVHSSRELNVFTQMETLYLSNDLTGNTELCSLFLHPDYRNGANSKLLSKSRFLFIAQFSHLFAPKLIAEMRGYQAEDGSSPFYEGLGRHFFKMDFNRVDDLTSLGKKSFIAELMPQQPIYVAYLPKEAQDVIGKVHLSTAPARHLLEQEGMHFEGYIDIFDAGPVLQGRVSELRVMRESVLATVIPQPNTNDVTQPNTLVANTTFDNFRVIMTSAVPTISTTSQQIELSDQERSALQYQPGNVVHTLSCKPKKNVYA